MKPRILGVGALILAAFVVVVFSLAAFGLTAPVVPCPLGFGAGRGPLDHLCCEPCHHSGKLTLAESVLLLVRQKGRWTWVRTNLCG